MSKTIRADYIDVRGKTPDFMMFGEVVEMTPTAREIWRAHRDKKKGYKPGKAYKDCKKQADKAKPKHALRRALAQGKDLDDLVLPDAKRHHVWDWN